VSGDDCQILRVGAVVIDKDVPLVRGEHQLQGGPVSNFLQPNDIGIEQFDDLPQFLEPIPLVLNVGAQELDVVVCDPNVVLGRRWTRKKYDYREDAQRGSEAAKPVHGPPIRAQRFAIGSVTYGDLRHIR
jgi:hypothetical protein